MGIGDWFGSKARRIGQPVPDTVRLPAGTGSLTGIDTGTSRYLLERALPRGVRIARHQANQEERAEWASPAEIRSLAMTGKEIILGKFDGFPIGHLDDKPMVTIASARSGKTSTVLKPALFTYLGSMLVLDPKGELAAATARHRRDVLGQNVHVLDPFGCSGEATASMRAQFNPLDEIDPASPLAIDDTDGVAQAIILDEPGANESHWTNAGRGLSRGLILHTLQKPEGQRNLVTMRELLMLTHPDLVAIRNSPEVKQSTDPEGAVQNALFKTMAADTTAFGGAVAAAGSSFLRKAPRERASIISTVETQTNFLDSAPMKEALRRSDFRLADLAGPKPTTIYLCLPAGHMQSHFRWLRLIVRLALTALERQGTYPRDRLPILFMMEEFASLGHMPIMEQAAAYFPGFGVKLWAILQDLSQLQRHYRDTWQTFLGNAGVIQFFANADAVTLDYLSRRMGSLTFVRGASSVSEEGKDHRAKERLAYTHELATVFARGMGYQVLLVDGKSPIAAERLTHDEVERLRQIAERIAATKRRRDSEVTLNPPAAAAIDVTPQLATDKATAYRLWKEAEAESARCDAKILELSFELDAAREWVEGKRER